MHCLMLEHEISHFIELISHSSSIELLERTIQEMLSIVSKACIERKTTNS